MCPTTINDFMRNSCVLLTGATGFIGGSLLQRILALDPGPKMVYLLVRKKQGVDPQNRLKDILSAPIFSGLDPEKLERVRVIPGDIAKEGLGLSEEHNRLLVSKCTHVFHAAAFISFAAQLELAIKINLLGARHVLALTKQMPNCKILVHTSTAYCNCTSDSQRVLEERLYPTPIDPMELIELVKNVPSEEIERRTPEILGGHANTYTFTKQMAENLLHRERGHVPLSIVRPGIVLNSWKVPFVGWIDNVNCGACAFIAGAQKGLFRTVHGIPENLYDVIPVDMVISTILASAPYAAENPKKVHIFHVTSSFVNPTTYGQYVDEIINASREYPCEDILWYPKATFRRSCLRNALFLYVFQFLPAFLFDLVSRLSDIKPKQKLFAIQQKYAKGMKYMSFFSCKEWTFDNRNTYKILEGLLPREKEIHPMDPTLIDWKDYFRNCVIGMRRYYHKEPLEITKKARLHMKRLEITATLTSFVTFSVFWYLSVLFGCSQTIGGIFSLCVILFLIWL